MAEFAKHASRFYTKTFCEAMEITDTNTPECAAIIQAWDSEREIQAGDYIVRTYNIDNDELRTMIVQRENFLKYYFKETA